MGERKNKATVVFGQVLQELRQAKGLTQEALALEAGTERSHISSLERAEKGPTLATILVLASALRMSAAQLMGMVEERLAGKKR